MAKIQALHMLQENADLLIPPVDNTIVILSTADYVGKISHPLEGPTYMRLANNPMRSNYNAAQEVFHPGCH
jgi:hypothetical protein